MRTIFFIVLFLLSSSLFAQEWARTMDATGGCCLGAVSLKNCPDGVLVLSNGNEPNAVFLTLLSSAGDSLFTRQYQTEGRVEYAEYLAKLSDSVFVMTGFYKEDTSEFACAFARAVNQQGEELWRKDYRLPGRSVQLEYLTATTSGLAGCGFISQEEGTGNDVWLCVTDSAGNLGWERAFGGERNEVGHMLVQHGDRLVVSADQIELNGATYNNYLFSVDISSAAFVWDLVIGDDYNNGNQALLLTSAGDYLLCGEGNRKGTELFDVFLARVSAEGELIWMKNLGSEGSEAGFQLAEHSDGGFIMTGYSSSYPGAGPAAVFLARLADDGTSTGVRYFTYPAVSIAYDLSYNGGDTCYLGGITGSSALVLRTCICGFTDVFQDLSDIDGASEQTFSAYPNPAAERIVFGVRPAELYSVTDAAGAVLWRGSPQSRYLDLDVSAWPPGIYCLRPEDPAVPPVFFIVV